MGYEKPTPKLTFYKAFFSAQCKFLIHTLVQCVSAKRTIWNEFSCSMAAAIICLATCRKFNFFKYIFDSMVRNVDSPSKFLMYLCFLQVIINDQVDDLTSHNTKYTSPALTQKVFTNMRRVGGCIQTGGTIKAIDVDEDITLVDVETQEEVAAMDAELQGGLIKKMLMLPAKELVLLKLLYLMMKRLHDEEVEKATAKEKQEKDDLERAKTKKMHYGINAAGLSFTAAGSRLMLLGKVDTTAEVTEEITLSGELRTSHGVPSNFDDGNAALL
nr:hypothetical protein [Tanacetum cinerariifolium]